MEDSQRIAELESLVLAFQDRANDMSNKLHALRLAVQKNCGHWYEPGYGLKTWVPDKWVPEALGFKPEGPDLNNTDEPDYSCRYCNAISVFEDDDVDGLLRCRACEKYWFK